MSELDVEAAAREIDRPQPGSVDASGAFEQQPQIRWKGDAQLRLERFDGVVPR